MFLSNRNIFDFFRWRFYTPGDSKSPAELYNCYNLNANKTPVFHFSGSLSWWKMTVFLYFCGLIKNLIWHRNLQFRKERAIFLRLK